MKTTHFDKDTQCTVETYTNIHEASLALAKQLHQAAVKNAEAIDSDWGVPGYIECMTREAKAMLEEKGVGPDEFFGNPIIKFAKEN